MIKLFLILFFLYLGRAADLFVATNGSNQNGNGSIANPYADLLYAFELAHPGDNILVRGGLYGTPGKSQGYWLYGKGGTADAWITIKNYNGENVIIDAKVNLNPSETIWKFTNVSYVVVDGLEIRNAQTEAACMYGAYGHYITIQNCIIHDCGGTCGQFIGTYYTFLNNEVYNCVMDNAYSNRTGGWAGSFGSGGMQPNGQPSANFVIRGNYVHNTWGEGISTPNVDGVEITNNVVVNAFSVSIYMDHVRNVNCSNNFIDVSNFTYRRGDNHALANGLGFSAEYYYDYPVAPFGVWNVLVANNIIVRANTGINYWDDTRNKAWTANYQNLQIINNLVLYPQMYSLWLDGPANSSVTVENNILNGNTSIQLTTGVTASNNNFVTGRPKYDNSPKSITANPEFVNANAATEYKGSDISIPISGLQFQPTSPCKFTGVYVPNVPTDFTGAVRPNPPSMGPIEYQSTSHNILIN